MIKPVSLKTNVSSYLVKSSEQKAKSLFQPLKKIQYTPEQIRIIETKIAECDELLKQYPYNLAARKTREICINMLRPSSQMF